MTTRTVCEKIGDWESWEHPDFKECEECTSTKCPIKVLINTIRVLNNRVQRLEDETVEVLRDALHQELVRYFEKRIVGILKLSGKSVRYGELISAVAPNSFWMQRHEAFENLKKTGKIVENRGWIKLAPKEKEASEHGC